MQTQGTEWMRKYNLKIGQMNMTELRSYMCQKSRGNPKRCEECDGFRNCQAGQRAVRLMNDEEAERIGSPEKNGTKKERDEFRTACESGNAWYYLMQTKNLSRDAAGDLLSKLARKFPGVAADFGGSRRIMQRPRMVKILDTATESAQSMQETAPPPQVEETNSREEETGEALRKAREKGAAANREKAMQKAREAFAADDPIAYIVQTDGIRPAIARNKIYRWAKAYPEISKGYQLPDSRRNKAESEKPEEKQETTEPAIAEDDTISLADFLAEHITGDEPADETPGPEPDEPENPDALRLEIWTAEEINAVDGDPREVLKHRAKWLEQEKTRMQEIIRKAEEKIAWIDERLGPLLNVIDNW